MSKSEWGKLRVLRPEHRQAVNQGDHGQDITRAIWLKPGTTVEDLVERELSKFDWDPQTKEMAATPDQEAFLTIRIVGRPHEEELT